MRAASTNDLFVCLKARDGGCAYAYPPYNFQIAPDY
jgi:hypothetical protein